MSSKLRRLTFALVGAAVLGLLGIPPRLAEAQNSSPMTFQAVRFGDSRICSHKCPIVIAASGQITQETPGQFLAFLQENGGGDMHAVVFIDSPGGRVVASMQFGTLLRRIGASVIVAGVYSDGQGGTVMTNAQCYSACVYALMGARKRVIPVRSLVGIHRMFVYEEGMDANGTTIEREKRYDNGSMRAFLMRYSSSMGVNPGLISAAERVPSDQLRILTPSEIRRWHLGVPTL